MKLGYAILYVQSVADTIAFYERAFGCLLYTSDAADE